MVRDLFQMAQAGRTVTFRPIKNGVNLMVTTRVSRDVIVKESAILEEEMSDMDLLQTIRALNARLDHQVKEQNGG